jgi:Domain of Unknown Function (DUF1259)
MAVDVAMLEHEVTPVLKTLRNNGIDVVAIHHHMTEEKPMVIFLHYWGRGPADKLPATFRATLKETGKGGGAHDATRDGSGDARGVTSLRRVPLLVEGLRRKMCEWRV